MASASCRKWRRSRLAGASAAGAVAAFGSAWAAPNLPVTLGAYSATYHGNGDAFVAKISAGGTGLAFASYLGGADAEQGGGVAVDASGNVYLTGSTRSGDFPTTSPLQAVLGGGTGNSSPCFDAFVTELDTAGGTLVYSTFLGGNGADYGEAIALDSSGNAYVTGL